ncbi:hypothetical protein AAG906_015455 [Vitis piasezkii]
MDDQLRRGQEISPALVKAIEESRFSVIVFSKNYPSSTWCLEELVKIIDCTMAMGHAALPTGSFAQAFAKHEEVYKEQMEKVIKWRVALTEAANISGWDSRASLKHASTGFSSISILTTSEKFLMQTTTKYISNKLIGTSSCYAEGLVGMDSRIKAMDSPLCIGLDNVRSVGIWGMGGIGISNTRINFVKDRLHSKKILIVLDDVDNLERLEYLAGNHDWGLEDSEAVQLFCQYAFKHNDPGEDYMQLCYDVIHYSKGLPLALKVLGAFLYSKSIHEWKSELDKLKRIPNKEIYFSILHAFVNGRTKILSRNTSKLWFLSDIGIRVLIDKSLIIGTKVVEGIVLDLSASKELHFSFDAFMKMNKLRLLKVCNMRLCGSFEYFSWKELCADSDACTRMNKLNQFKDFLENMGSLLKLFLYGTAIKKLPSSIQHLSGLVPLNLRECKSLAILPHSIRKLKSLQTLILSGCSKLDNLPKGLGSLQGLEKLEAAATAIKELPPSISLLENLEVLSFEGCKGLESKPRNSLPSFQLLPAEIGRSRGFQLHSFFGLRSLRKLNLSDCNILEGAIPNDFSSLCSLEYLDLSRNNFVTLPASLNLLSRPKGLRLGYCKRLQSLPELPSSIEEIDAHDCTVTENILCPSSVYRSKELVQPTQYRLHSNGTSASKLVYTRLMGLAVCAIFVVKGAVHDCPGNIFCHLNLTRRFIKSDHMWLGYQPICRIGIGHANWLNKLSQIQASFQVYGPSYGVKKCGVHLLYQQDEKEDNQPEFQCSTTDENSSFFTIKDYGGRKLVDTPRDIYTYLQGRRVWKLLENARDIHTYLHLARRPLEKCGVF